MVGKAQGWLGLMPEVWAGHRKGRPRMARALGSPDLGTEMEKQEGWVGTALGPGHFCFLSSVRLSWTWSCLELWILAV